MILWIDKRGFMKKYGTLDSISILESDEGTTTVRFWHKADIEAARSNVRFRAPFGRQREGAQFCRRRSHKNMSTFEIDEHLQAVKSSQNCTL